MDNLTNAGSTVAEKGLCFDIGARDRALNEAIDLASAEILREFLELLHHVSPNVKQMVEETFLAVEESGGEGPDDLGSNLTNAGSTVAEKGLCFDIGARDRALDEAIDLANAKTLREFLKLLHHLSPNVKQMVEETFLVVEESGGEGPDDGKNGGKQRKYQILGSASGNKLVRPRYVPCEQCREEFDVTKNNDTACFWHDGSLKIDEEKESWDDWDHDEMDSEENQKLYPEAFAYYCCGKNGRGRGCLNTAHKEVVRIASRKKTNFLGVPIA